MTLAVFFEAKESHREQMCKYIIIIAHRLIRRRCRRAKAMTMRLATNRGEAPWGDGGGGGGGGDGEGSGGGGGEGGERLTDKGGDIVVKF